MRRYLFISYLKDHLKIIGFYLLFLMIFLIIFSLYNIHVEPIFYAAFLCTLITIIYMIFDFIHYYKKHEQLKILEKQIEIHLAPLPMSQHLIEKDYQDLLQALQEERLKIKNLFNYKQTEMMDYYTLWAHQIKTPIAAMRLLVQSEPSALNKEILEQLFKIEQYVEMVLGYLRIENTSSDLVLEKHQLSDLVKQAIRKYASQFIRKNIKLEFEEMSQIILTDEKWFVFVMEQLLSNALKYTSSGTISIYLDCNNQNTLVIEDTGIGIAEEDLPRIFEKGYTGYNGRMDKKATGIGLYLCQKVLNKLSHQIKITSQINVGTRVMINLESVQTTYE